MKTERTVRNCRDGFAFVCPKRWEGLAPTGDENVRHCPACNEDVFFCRTDEETLRRAKAGQCIAREMPDGSELSPIVLGRPETPLVPTPEQEEAGRAWRRERGIDAALENLKYAHRACPGCGYPMPDWKLRCTVCDRELGRVV
jgi:hypothetical protein